MDEIVKAAIAKWPRVPHCRGWLGLDARGAWYLRDEPAQAAGAFPQFKGSRIEHEPTRQFIDRNYAGDEQGAWYFQNGPQRVYVELEAAPWIWRLQPTEEAGRADLLAHTGAAACYRAALLDEQGRVFVATDRGLGLVHSLDVEIAATAIDSGQWQIEDVRFDDLPQRFGYQLSPAGVPR